MQAYLINEEISKAKLKLNDSEALLLDIIKKNLFDTPIDVSAYNREEIDWGGVFREACRHNVLPIVLHNINDLIAEFNIPEEKVEKWRITTYNQIAFNEKLMFYQNRVVEILDKAHIPYAVLKGSSLSACYPRPDLRILQDIDLLLKPSDFGQALSILCEHGFNRRIIGKHFHEVLEKDDIVVEPHYSVSYIDKSNTGGRIRDFFEDALERTERETVGAYSFEVLSVAHQAVALLLHIERHIAENKLDLRRICDWAMFVYRKTTNEIWVSQIEPELIRCGLNKFAMLITKICVIFLGLSSEHCSWAEGADSNLCKKLFIIIYKNYSISSKQPSFIVLCALRFRREFPRLSKIPILIPLGCIFIQLRYLYEMSTGKRAKISVLKTVHEAVQISHIFSKLKLYKAGY